MLAENPKTEQRQFPRRRFHQPVAYKAVAGKEFGGCLSYDLGEGGIRFRLNDFVPPGQEFFLSIPVKREKVWEVLGRVVWINKRPHDDTYTVGIKFISQEDKTSL